MHVPEQLFRPQLLKDLRTQQIEVVHRTYEFAVAALDMLLPLYNVPNDRIFIVTSWAVNLVNDGTGGGMTGAYLRTLQGGQFFFHGGKSWGYVPSGVVQYRQTLGDTGSIWLPPGTEIYAGCSNICSGNPPGYASLSGLSIPRASVSVG